MDEDDTQAYYARCIITTSIEYARRYIKVASLPTLTDCLETIAGRKHTKTLQRAIKTRISQLTQGEKDD